MSLADAPVCVVKRFRKLDSTACATPLRTAPSSSSSAGSFELITGDIKQPEVESGQDLIEFSPISPVDLFAAETESDVGFQNRWTEFGDYDFNYQPGGASDPFATAGRRLNSFGTSGDTAWQPPQKQTRHFVAPGFQKAVSLWQPPPAVRKSRASLDFMCSLWRNHIICHHL